MGKLNLVVEDAPVRIAKESKNQELHQEVAEAFNRISIGKALIVQNSEVPCMSLIAKIKKLITLNKGEDLRISRIYGADKKLTAIRLIKTAAKQPKVSDSQGEDKSS